MFEPLSPAVVERTTLTEIEVLCQNLLAELRAVPANAPAPILASIINQIDRYAQRFQAFTSQALWLKMRGYPQVAQRLDYIQRDLALARAQRVQMQQDAVQVAQQQQQIWDDANAFATNNILAATAASHASFDTSMQGFFDVWENRCYDCHRHIKIVAGGYCLDCARRRGLVW